MMPSLGEARMGALEAIGESKSGESKRTFPPFWIFSPELKNADESLATACLGDKWCEAVEMDSTRSLTLESGRGGNSGG
jgi:hypothetical protein